MSFFDQLIARFSMPTGDFFKRVKRFGIFLTGLSAVIMGLQSQVPSFQLPHTLFVIASYFTVAGVFITGVAQLTVQNPNDVQSK